MKHLILSPRSISGEIVSVPIESIVSLSVVMALKTADLLRMLRLQLL